VDLGGGCWRLCGDVRGIYHISYYPRLSEVNQLKHKRVIAIALLIGWLLGIGTGLGYVALHTGFYEYYWAANLVEARETLNYQGWQPVPGSPNNLILQRPRYRLFW